MEKEKYNVYVVRTDDFKATKLLCQNVSHEEAHAFESMNDYDGIDYFVSVMDVGCERDLELARDLI